MTEPKGRRSKSNTDFSSLNAKEAKFVELVGAQGFNLSEAYRLVYPEKASSKWAGIYASKLATSPKIKEQIELLRQAMRAQFAVLALKAVDRVEELAENARNERVKLDANIEILRQAGLAPPQRVENVHIGIFGNASAEDVRHLIRKKVDSAQYDEQGRLIEMEVKQEINELSNVSN